ncbi:MAG TPA: rhodanese-like domain-containing protein [Acidimicrobiales bacterium]
MVDASGDPPSRVDALLAERRSHLDRVSVEELDDVRAAGALVVDIRPVGDRIREGALPGAIVIDRNVLEWRLDPTSPNRVPEAVDADRRIVLVCNEGYASSIAAVGLQDLGLPNATDLVGGYRAWRSAVDRTVSTAPPTGHSAAQSVGGSTGPAAR